MYYILATIILFFGLLIGALCYSMYLKADCIKNAQTADIALVCEAGI